VWAISEGRKAAAAVHQYLSTLSQAKQVHATARAEK
jgi:hypothetical protein